MTFLIVIGCYLAALLAIGLIARRYSRGTSDDYMLASHSIGPFLLLMSLFGTAMTAFAIVGSTGAAFTLGVGVYGMLASASGIVHSLCFLIIGVPLWAIGRRHGYRTQIQFFRERLDNQMIGFVLFPILVGLVVTYILLGIVAAGAVASEVTQGAFEPQGWFAEAKYGVPRWIGSGVVCAVVLFYVFLGGMRGTVWVNTLQTCIFTVLGLVIFVAIANALGGTDDFFENLKIATAAVPESNLARTKLTPAMYFSFLLIPLSLGMFPHVFQHWLTARSARTFKLSIIMHPILIMIVWAPCVLIGIWAAGTDIEFTGENVVLATMVQTLIGPLMGGLVTAGLLSAVMSSLDSQFLCLGTMFTEDVVRNLFPKLKDRTLVACAKLFVIAIVVLTFILSLYPRPVFNLGLWSFAGFTGLFPLVFAAIYWRRLTASGAIASVFVAAAIWLTLFWRSGFGSNQKYVFPENPIELGPIVIPQMLSVVTILAAAAITLIAVSMVTSPPKEETVKKFFRSTWKLS